MSGGRLVRSRPARRSAFALGVSIALACGGDEITAPTCDRCNELRILSDRAEYRPGGLVRFTISNLTRHELTYDWCSITLSSRTTNAPFEIVYAPSKRCGRDAGIQQVVANMVTITPGETRRDSLVVTTAAFQGQQRIHLWLVDAHGIPETGNPVTSNVFLILPGADQT